ncbi:hypothetical protein BCR42DRAFT_421233 [Absidia repens]|uniref:Uncharacterized protein n=1 Tax=Absidia repens TaxID=90262 RepID=A0A1X2I877_9FUNG|nr:hypothetical protein BCR42DRAFT_421233 [Absidia repens]
MIVRVLFAMLAVTVMTCVDVVSAVYAEGDPAMVVTICPIGKGTIDNSKKCSYTINARTEKDGATSQFKLASANCHHAKIKNTAYVFQRNLATTTPDILEVQSPCSAGLVDSLQSISSSDHTPCKTYTSPICVSKQK